MTDVVGRLEAVSLIQAGFSAIDATKLHGFLNIALIIIIKTQPEKHGSENQASYYDG